MGIKTMGQWQKGNVLVKFWQSWQSNSLSARLSPLCRAMLHAADRFGPAKLHYAKLQYTVLGVLICLAKGTSAQAEEYKIPERLPQPTEHARSSLERLQTFESHSSRGSQQRDEDRDEKIKRL